MVVKTAFVANVLAINLYLSSIIDEREADGFLQAWLDSDCSTKVTWLVKPHVKRLRIADPFGSGSSHQGGGKAENKTE